MASKSLTYANYLCIDELLSLQRPRSEGPEHDELLFIVIHQVNELWFKQILHELDALESSLDEGRSERALAHLRRMLTILKTLVAQVDILETMTPLSFNAFRARLEAASGFQSVQFRVLEFRLGHCQEAALQAHPPGSSGRALLEQAQAAPPLFAHLLRYLASCGYTPSSSSSSSSHRHPHRHQATSRRRGRPCWSRCTATAASRRRSASALSILTRACRSGATATPRWSSGRSA